VGGDAALSAQEQGRLVDFDPADPLASVLGRSSEDPDALGLTETTKVGGDAAVLALDPSSHLVDHLPVAHDVFFLL
jgi:hypothetical protein